MVWLFVLACAQEPGETVNSGGAVTLREARIPCNEVGQAEEVLPELANTMWQTLICRDVDGEESCVQYNLRYDYPLSVSYSGDLLDVACGTDETEEVDVVVRWLAFSA